MPSKTVVGNLKYDESVDILRGVGIIMVLAIHSSFSFSGQALVALGTIQAISAPSVLIFFFCSGYCLPPRCSRALKASHFLPILRFLVVFLFWSLLYYALAFIICWLAPTCSLSGGAMLLDLFDFGEIPGSAVGFQLYFLVAFAIIRLFDLLLYQSLPLGRLSFCGFHSMVAAVALLFLGMPTNWHGPSWSNLAIYLFSFGIGRIASADIGLPYSPANIACFLNAKLPKFAVTTIFLLIIPLFGFVAVPDLAGMIFLPIYLCSMLIASSAVSLSAPLIFSLLAAAGITSGGLYLLHAPFLSSILFKLYSRLFSTSAYISPLIFLSLLLASSVLMLLLLRLFVPSRLSKLLLLTDDSRLSILLHSL